MAAIQDNQDLAFEIINYTSKNLFLTGKAGTGKTTFLKKLIRETKKKVTVVAPTGIAAINAGGMTLHSFFQLSGRPFVPDYNVPNIQEYALDRYTLFKNARVTGNKIELYKEVELVIIDEVSMLRADMLDAIDEVLRHYRNVKNKPFGGVQMLFIGDLFQLPPVMPDHEWRILSPYYKTPYFFSAKVFENDPLIKIEFKTIYRQSEQRFIKLLNKVRNNQLEYEDFEELNERHGNQFSYDDNVITLTAYNRSADEINNRELNQLDSEIFKYNALVKDDFNEKSYPTDVNMQLKVGAQVIFIKNDSSPQKRYVNGSLAKVDYLTNEEVHVTLATSGNKIIVEKEVWKNIKYEFDRVEDKIEEKEMGSFTQFPLRLAWAITIHKSQGLTFDKVAIEAGSAFATGQVYVALSRCTTFDGITLLSRLSPQSIQTDSRIREFTETETSEMELENIVAKEKPIFLAQQLYNTFNFKKLTYEAEDYLAMINGKRMTDNVENIVVLASEIIYKSKEIRTIGDKFGNQIKEILGKENNINLLQERIQKGLDYITNFISTEILSRIAKIIVTINGQKKVKQIEKSTLEFSDFIKGEIKRVSAVSYPNIELIRPEFSFLPSISEIKKDKMQPGTTHRESLTLYQSGKTIGEIIEIRNLAAITIEQHLASFVTSGEINAFDFISETDYLLIISKAQEAGGFDVLTPIKQLLPEDYTFSKIRFAIEEYKRKNQNKKM
ncbi:MAG: hypothetical protein EAZ27_03770 [Cytophagales bacterium]|nr:MAG: hypothetical protein EAZ27_03770 [Cytophagales bacterium]